MLPIIPQFEVIWNVFSALNSAYSTTFLLIYGNYDCRISPTFSSWFSLLFMLARTLGVFVMASHINIESKRTIKILNRVPSNLYDMEVKRFSSEVVCNLVALSGGKFFHLTYDVMLSVAGTVAAYELFLMQM